MNPQNNTPDDFNDKDFQDVAVELPGDRERLERIEDGQIHSQVPPS
jgi:hypothetical protein